MAHTQDDRVEVAVDPMDELTTIAQNKETILSVINNGSCFSDVHCVVNSIPFADLQIFLRDYVNKKTSLEKITHMVTATKSLPSIVGDDCIMHILEYLNSNELSTTVGVNKSFNLICSKIFFDRMLFESPAFEESFCINEYSYCDTLCYF